jgi:hypothetical protein
MGMNGYEDGYEYEIIHQEARESRPQRAGVAPLRTPLGSHDKKKGEQKNTILKKQKQTE